MEDLSKCSVDELVEFVKNLIWNKQCIDSYMILSELVKRGYDYEKDSFDSIISKIRGLKSTITYRDSDLYMQCKELLVVAVLPDLKKRRNCYSCPFLDDINNNYELKKIYDSSSESDDDRVYCALDQTLHIKLSMDRIPKKCPINIALELQEKENKESTN